MFALLAGAGIAAGLTGSIAGLASLFSYPALLAAGLPATAANVTNTVSLAVGSLSTITSSRPDLVGQAGIARRLGLICAAGGAAGASLLLVTPSGLFARIVPFLVAAASVLMLLGRRAPVAMGERHAEGPRRRRPGALVGCWRSRCHSPSGCCSAPGSARRWSAGCRQTCCGSASGWPGSVLPSSSPWTPSSDPAAGNWSHLIAEGR